MAPLKPNAYTNQLLNTIQNQNGRELGNRYLNLQHSDATELYIALPQNDTNLNYAPATYEAQYRRLGAPWGEIAKHHTRVIIAQKNQPQDLLTAYDSQHQLLTLLYRWMIDSTTPTAWALPVLYVASRDLRTVAEQADKLLTNQGKKTTKLEEASRLFQKCFSACLNDRAPDPSTSRKMGTYFMANLLFKVYFKLNSTSLCKNLTNGIKHSELAPFESYPASHRTTYLYYLGLFAFLKEDYAEAEKLFFESLTLCHKKYNKNVELILDYLVPIMLLRGVLPGRALLVIMARIRAVYGPFVDAFRTGDVNLYDRQLKAAEKRLTQRGTYLVVERAREGAVRALLKKAWILEGKPSRVAVGRFAKYLNAGMGGTGALDDEEVECVLANMIYKGRMKGYIAHAQQIVVLSKDRPFPWYPPLHELPLQASEQRVAAEKAAFAKLPPPSQLVVPPPAA